MKYNDNENIYWPRKVNFWDIMISSAWTFISGLIWSILIIIIVFFLSNMLNLEENFSSKIITSWRTPLFPFILSFITFIVSSIVCVINYNFLALTDPDKYKKTMVSFWNILFFSILVYVFLAPGYMYVWTIDYNYLVYVFIIHILILSFWQTLILEILNNYRYVLLGLYSSFIGFFVTSLISIFIFSLFNEWFAKLISLLILLPLINGLTILFKWIFEMVYYAYFKFSWNDNLWDVFKQIQAEEDFELRQALIQSQKY